MTRLGRREKSLPLFGQKKKTRPGGRLARCLFGKKEGEVAFTSSRMKDQARSVRRLVESVGQRLRQPELDLGERMVLRRIGVNTCGQGDLGQAFVGKARVNQAEATDHWMGRWASEFGEPHKGKSG